MSHWQRSKLWRCTWIYPPIDFVSALNQAWYCSSLTFSIQSAVLPSSCSWMAICVMAVVGVAPCQCFSPRRDPDHITRPDFLDLASPALHAAAAGRHDQGLAERVGVPCCPGAGLEGDTGAERTCRSGWLEQGVNAHRAGKILGRSLAGRL